MLDRVYKTLTQNCDLCLDQTILVAVSGGMDSLCLVDILKRLGIELVIAHMDHGLRPESGREAEFVGELADQLGVPFVLRREDVHLFAEANSLSIEEAARIVRYRFLFQVAVEQNIQAVAVAHTADDQVETVLMHLLRGSGLSGLQGMGFRSLPNAWSKNIPLVRPLLGIWREEISNYIDERKLSPVLDESNLDTRFLRNRIRHELIPYLEGIAPRFRQSLWRTADILRADHKVLEKDVNAGWDACVLESGSEYIALDTKRLMDQPLGIQRRVIRRAIDQLNPGLGDIDFSTVDRALSILEKSTSSAQADLAAGLRILLEGQKIWLSAWDIDLPGYRWPQTLPGEELSLNIPGELNLENDWVFYAQKDADAKSALAQSSVNENPFQAWLDFDRTEQPLRIRTRLPGDRFKPLGLDGHSLKISDFFINVKLPRRAREAWPLVISGDEIAWVPGYRLANPFRLHSGSNAAVHIQLIRTNS